MMILWLALMVDAAPKQPVAPPPVCRQVTRGPSQALPINGKCEKGWKEVKSQDGKKVEFCRNPERGPAIVCTKSTIHEKSN